MTRTGIYGRATATEEARRSIFFDTNNAHYSLLWLTHRFQYFYQLAHLMRQKPVELQAVDDAVGIRPHVAQYDRQDRAERSRLDGRQVEQATGIEFVGKIRITTADDDTTSSDGKISHHNRYKNGAGRELSTETRLKAGRYASLCKVKWLDSHRKSNGGRSDACDLTRNLISIA